MYHSFPERIVKVAKQHRCWGCVKIIDKGELALYQSGVWENEGFYNGWFCKKCASFIKSKNFDWSDYDDGLYQGDLPNDYRYESFEPVEVILNGKTI